MLSPTLHICHILSLLVKASKYVLYIQYVQYDELGCYENLQILGLNGSVTFFLLLSQRKASFFFFFNLIDFLQIEILSSGYSCISRLADRMGKQYVSLLSVSFITIFHALLFFFSACLLLLSTGQNQKQETESCAFLKKHTWSERNCLLEYP